MRPNHSKTLGILIFLVLLVSVLPLISQDWPMWGGTAHRNMTSPIQNLPSSWDIKTGRNVKWKATIPIGTELITEYGMDIVEIERGRISRNEVYFDRSIILEALRKRRST